MKKLSRTFLTATLILAAASGTALADGTTKDIVLNRISSPLANRTAPIASVAVASDAMAVSVLLESVDGTLVPKSTNTLFHTGDRFRVKLLASRNAKVSLYNTNPKGETNSQPIWQGEVKVGLETISPRLELAGNSGVDQLHIVLEPVRESNIALWLGEWINATKEGGEPSKDIRLDVQNTPSSTYVLNAGGQGLVNTVQIMHAAH